MPKSHILRGRRMFAEIFNTGSRRSRGPLLLIARPNQLSYHRLGIITPKKVGNAVRRNRVRRQLREAFRLMQHDLPIHHDILLIARLHNSATLTDYQKLLADLMLSLKNA
ncbi:MAG TPA: ribonuclease P protein component [Tepidisphaeraceae bacterium]|nr:ribonuclease P protein component [Tepidisphaeraceae bacterium]